WCFSIKQGGRHGRNRWYHESRDFMQGADWSKAVFWANADRLDEPDPQIGVPAQLYSLSAVAYESILLGMFQIHLGPDNTICNRGRFPKMTELKLGFSRDGFHWHRPDRRAFIAATRQEGDWDRAYLHTTTGVCVILDDQLVFPFCGYSGIAPSGHRGMYTGGSIGLATLRRDGFASMDGAGELTTHPVMFSGRHLFVNVNGELYV
ncbi:MAG: glycosyl hydrolase family 32, partial [Planctomycetaceae bacterium]